jgi:lipoprotein NlpI
VKRLLLAAIVAHACALPAQADSPDTPNGPDINQLMTDCAQAEANRDAAATIAICGKALDTAGLPDSAIVAALVARARAQIAQHDDAAAIVDLDKAIARRPDAAELRYLRALAGTEQGDNEGAIRDAGEAIRLAPDSAVAYRLRGAALEKLQRNPEAIADYAQAVRTGGGPNAAPEERALRAGIAATLTGDAAGALPDLATAGRDGMATAPRAALWRNLARRSGRLPSAADLNAAAAALDPAAWPAPLFAYYQGALPEDQLETAAQSADPAVGAAQACDVTFYVAARALADGAFPVAHAGFEQAVSVCPPGGIESDAAKAQALTAAAADAATAPVLEDMFACQGASKDRDNARMLDRCTKALASAALPDAWRLGALVHRAQAHFETGDVGHAVADADAALALKPDAESIYESRGVYRIEKGEIEGGIADLSYALTLSPGNPGFYLDRAWGHARKGDTKSALADAGRAIELQPDTPRLLLNRGAIAWLAGDTAAAGRDFAAVIDAAPQAPYAVLWLALAVNHGQKDAVDTLQRGAAALDGTAWPAPILQHINGVMSAQELAQEAAKAPDREAAKKQSCEAAFYAGMNASLAGRMQDSITYLGQARNLCFKGSLEYQAAMVALGR